MLRASLPVVLSTVLLMAPGGPMMAQSTLAVQADVVFYGDNTEFHGPFRDGETLFGASGRVCAVAGLSDRVTVTLGVFGDHRYGGGGFARASPIAALNMSGPRSTLTIGTLSRGRAPVRLGPDLESPHGLLPPFQRDSLAFERPYEAGMEWTSRGARGAHDSWLNWQRLNTSAHRERFDVGSTARARIAPALDLGVQLHVVHQGGQLFASGPVAGSAAYAAGAVVEHGAGPTHVSLELWGALARYVPDRQAPDRSMTGRGVFARAAGERAGWRAHVIVWRARDFAKDEGDANYQSLRLDGSRYRGTRDYSEAGLARRFRPAREVVLDVSARSHRVEGHYNYSFRITATTNLSWRIR